MYWRKANPLKRILGVVRLSQLTDDSSSPHRQREAIEYWADSPHVEGEIIGWAEDLDVSGGLSPFKRQGLCVLPFCPVEDVSPG
jgi:hypothetical protein